MDRIEELVKLIENRRTESAAVRQKAVNEKRQALTPEEIETLKKISEDLTAYSKELSIEREMRDAEHILNLSANKTIVRPDPRVDHLDELQAKHPGLPPKDKRFESFAEQLKAIKKACQPGGYVDPRLMWGAATGSSETIPADGGFLVQQDFSSEIWKRAEQMSEVVRRVTKIPVQGNGLKIPYVKETTRVSTIWGGITIYRLEEAGTKLPSKPQFGEFDFKLKKLIGAWWSTDELIADAPALAALVYEGFAKAIDRKKEDEIINGVGGGQMVGIVNHAAKIAVTRILAGHIDYIDITNMWARCYGPSKTNSVWMIESSVIPDLFQMTFPGLGTPVYLPPGGASGSPYSTIFGKPVLEIECGQALGTEGDIMLADLSQYAMIEKGGIEVAWTNALGFLTDETVYRWVTRNDGQPGWASALTPKSGGATVSPFITLAT